MLEGKFESSKMTDLVILERVETIINNIKNDPALVALLPLATIAETEMEGLHTDRQEEKTLMDARELQTKVRKATRRRLNTAMGNLLMETEILSKTDPTIRAKVGFDERDEPTVKDIPGEVPGVKITLTTTAGKIKVQWTPMGGHIQIYNLYMTKSLVDPVDWKLVDQTSQSKIFLIGMPSKEDYYIAVNARSSKGERKEKSAFLVEVPV